MEHMMNKAKMDEMMTKAHGRKESSVMMAHQGMSAFMGGKSSFPAQNPLTKTGGKVMESMMKGYGAKKGKQVFYASINAKKKGVGSWHK